MASMEMGKLRSAVGGFKGFSKGTVSRSPGLKRLLASGVNRANTAIRNIPALFITNVFQLSLKP
jgi:hypothetical protein